MANFKQQLKRDKNYLDLYPILRAIKKNKADVYYIMAKKGIGKTVSVILEALRQYSQNGLPSAYIRATHEQIKEFTSSDKFYSLLDLIGWKSYKSEKVNSKGFYLHKQKKGHKPIIYFTSINNAKNVQSSKFEKLAYAIVDEAQDHFAKDQDLIFEKMINLLASILRNHNCPIIIISNKISKDSLILNGLKISQKIDNIPVGHCKTFQTYSKMPDGESVALKTLVLNAAASSNFEKELKKSVGFKLASFNDYAKSVIGSDDFYIQEKNLRYIKELGHFKANLNINGKRIGFWVKHVGDKQIYQFSKKLNPNGKTFYFSYSDYEKNSLIGSFNFIWKVKNKLVKNEVEFDFMVFETILNLLKNAKNK